MSKETVPTQRKPRLTKKQKGFVKDYIELGNGTKAALKNYDTKDPRVAQTIASENLSKPIIVKSIQEALPEELLAQVHLDGLNANFKGEPDFGVRHKYLDSAYKLKGSYAAEKSVSLSMHIEASADEIDKLQEIAARLLLEIEDD